jgi:hypothetical protein
MYCLFKYDFVMKNTNNSGTTNVSYIAQSKYS